MESQSLKLNVSESIAEVSAEWIQATQAIATLTLAHGAGAGMNHPFMVGLALELAKQNVSTLRFNFPFIENKKRRPDVPTIAHKTIEAAVKEAEALAPHASLFLAGKSFGGRMSSQFLALQPNAYVKGIVLFGFPLHPAGKPGVERAEHLKRVNAPMLFLQGEKDELAQWVLLEEVTKSLPQATLIRFEGADHAFKKGKENLLPLLAEETAKWIASTK
ncbi:MAG: alpha/beta family hydrolase [Bacteroidota bacterium]|jgi:predicted alpha/beta-hydrolase family hydrolase|nr:dienelactone hydrolase family protein [Cytophagales bacterium]